MVFKGIEFKIGQFIQCIKRKPGNADIKQELVNIFGQNVLLIGASKTFSDDEKLEACRLFMNKYNTVPNYIDKIKIHNKMFNIGSFIYMVKCGMYRDLRQEIEQIFHTSSQGASRSFPDHGGTLIFSFCLESPYLSFPQNLPEYGRCSPSPPTWSEFHP